MSDLETKLAEAREGIMPNDVSEMAASHRRAFDAAAAIAREVVAKKDDEIALLANKPRKVTDAQREQRFVYCVPCDIVVDLDNVLTHQWHYMRPVIIAESTDEPNDEG
jgi:hypothetical protein